ncbi:MAG: ATP-dependent RNA helicase DbpA [Halieaceae bacterium]|jgi:ATP-independent RNA helicase DbpA|nr:MAG: ATP-dependent RNA helicase DbpA [Halieaceae bacterium]
MSSPNFASLPISPQQLEALQGLGYASMTPVQAQSLPLILSGKDVIIQAKTGSGKTAAFGIGLLNHLNPRFFGVQALVVCPTRELAEQVGQSIRQLASRMANVKTVLLCGGKPFGPQRDSLHHGAHIVVGTPGRIQDHLQRGTLDLKGVRTFVLDEADRMLEMGFAEVMASITSHLPKNRQTILLSATFPDDIKNISRSLQEKPIQITVDAEVSHDEVIIEQLFFEVQRHERDKTLLALFEHHRPRNAMVFCNTKKQCAEVARFLSDHDIEAAAIHGDLDQRERDQVLVQFANESCPVLVASDVAARGLDIPALEMVVNVELPRDADTYVHRIGRTGRAGQSGKAFSLVAPSEVGRMRVIEDYLGNSCVCDVLASLDRDPNYELRGPMITVQLDAGRKQKVRPGDILGALTGDAGLSGDQIGKISIMDNWSYVAVHRAALRQAMNFLADGKVKGRAVRARRLKTQH